MHKVGILAGTFDPVHEGHLAFARQALEQCGLDKVFFLVEPHPRRKQGVRALEHRERMVQLAIAGDPKLGSIVLEHARFSVDETLPILKRLYKGAELHLLFGDDVLKHLADWPHVEDLIKDVRFVIAVRAGKTQTAQSQLESLSKARGIKLQYSLFPSSAPDFASSRIRLNYKRSSPIEGVPAEVQDYIQANGLYSSDNNS